LSDDIDVTSLTCAVSICKLYSEQWNSSDGEVARAVGGAISFGFRFLRLSLILVLRSKVLGIGRDSRSTLYAGSREKQWRPALEFHDCQDILAEKANK